MAQTLDTLMKLRGTAIGEAHLLCDDAVTELNRACGKFPRFPDKFHTTCKESTKEWLRLAREYNDRNGGEDATAESVIEEELYEFYEAMHNRDRDAARKEIVQTIAMLLRSYIHLDDYIPASL